MFGCLAAAAAPVNPTAENVQNINTAHISSFTVIFFLSLSHGNRSCSMRAAVFDAPWSEHFIWSICAMYSNVPLIPACASTVGIPPFSLFLVLFLLPSARIAIELHKNAKKTQEGTQGTQIAALRALRARKPDRLYALCGGTPGTFLKGSKSKCKICVRPFNARAARAELPGCQLTLRDPTDTQTPRERAAPPLTHKSRLPKICKDIVHTHVPTLTPHEMFASTAFRARQKRQLSCCSTFYGGVAYRPAYQYNDRKLRKFRSALVSLSVRACYATCWTYCQVGWLHGAGVAASICNMLRNTLVQRETPTPLGISLCMHNGGLP